MMNKLKMSQVLIDADQSKQMEGAYLQGWNETTKKAQKYCALGYLACASNSVTDGILDGIEHMVHIKYGMPKKIFDTRIYCPVCKLKDVAERYNQLPTHMIIHLNDIHHWKFIEIGKWLKTINL